MENSPKLSMLKWTLKKSICWCGGWILLKELAVTMLMYNQSPESYPPHKQKFPLCLCLLKFPTLYLGWQHTSVSANISPSCVSPSLLGIEHAPCSQRPLKPLGHFGVLFWGRTFWFLISLGKPFHSSVVGWEGWGAEEAALRSWAGNLNSYVNSFD